MKIPGQKLLAAAFGDARKSRAVKQAAANAPSQDVFEQDVIARAAHADSLVNFIQNF